MARSATSSTFAPIGLGTARPWLERLARAGYAARGAIYALVGFLAVETAFGARARPADTRGALQEMAGRSTALLWAVAVGLAGYALWRIVQGLLNPERKPNDLKGLAHRVGRIGSAAGRFERQLDRPVKGHLIRDMVVAAKTAGATG